jgi:hypothetical protein
VYLNSVARLLPPPVSSTTSTRRSSACPAVGRTGRYRVTQPAPASEATADAIARATTSSLARWSVPVIPRQRLGSPSSFLNSAAILPAGHVVQRGAYKAASRCKGSRCVSTGSPVTVGGGRLAPKGFTVDSARSRRRSFAASPVWDGVGGRVTCTAQVARRARATDRARARARDVAGGVTAARDAGALPYGRGACGVPRAIDAA